MKIQTVKDIKQIASTMHDSEFDETDFRYDPGNKKFFLRTRSPSSGEIYHLELANIERYEPVNLERIKQGKGLGGVFNFVKIGRGGTRLTFVSQDLQIRLSLSKLEGEFDILIDED